MIDFTLDNLAELRETYDPKVVNKALNSSISKMASKASTLISKEVRTEYNIKAADVRASLKVKRARTVDSERVLLYSGGRISLMKFDPQETRVVGGNAVTTKRLKDGFGSRRKRLTKRTLRGVTVRVKKREGRKRVKGQSGLGGFMGRARGNGVLRIFMRRGKERLPIDSLTTLSVPQMVDRPDTLTKVQDLIRDDAPKQFAHAMDFYLGNLTKTGGGDA